MKQYNDSGTAKGASPERVWNVISGHVSPISPKVLWTSDFRIDYTIVREANNIASMSDETHAFNNRL